MVQGEEISKLQRLYLQPLVLSSVALQSGISNLGDTRRLEHALYKLVSGPPPPPHHHPTPSPLPLKLPPPSTNMVLHIFLEHALKLYTEISGTPPPFTSLPKE